MVPSLLEAHFTVLALQTITIPEDVLNLMVLFILVGLVTNYLLEVTLLRATSVQLIIALLFISLRLAIFNASKANILLLSFIMCSALKTIFFIVFTDFCLVVLDSTSFTILSIEYGAFRLLGIISYG